MRIVAIGDTHGFHKQIDIPNGDVLIFAGDILRYGGRKELVEFNSWLGTLPQLHRIVIAGNHDVCFEMYPNIVRGILTNASYLQDEEIVIDGIKFYGSPWTSRFGDWAFMLDRGEGQAEKWKQIPNDTDVLVTHSPPYGILDEAMEQASNGNRYLKSFGSRTLRDRLNELSLKAHIFGHIHEGHGKEEIYYNVSICNKDYQPVNPVTIIEI